MKDDLEDLLGDILQDVNLENVSNNQEVSLSENLESLLNDVLDDINLDEVNLSINDTKVSIENSMSFDNVKDSTILETQSNQHKQSVSQTVAPAVSQTSIDNKVVEAKEIEELLDLDSSNDLFEGQAQSHKQVVVDLFEDDEVSNEKEIDTNNVNTQVQSEINSQVEEQELVPVLSKKDQRKEQKHLAKLEKNQIKLDKVNEVARIKQEKLDEIARIKQEKVDEIARIKQEKVDQAAAKKHSKKVRSRKYSNTVSEPTEDEGFTDNQNNNPKKKTKVKKKRGFFSKLLRTVLITIIMTLLIILGWFIWDRFYKVTDVDVFNRISLVTAGGHEHATLTIDLLDYEGEDEAADPIYEGLLELLELEADKTKNLANKDKISISVKNDETIEEYLKTNRLRLVPETKEFEISGLKDSREFNFFKDTIVTVEGVNGSGKASFINSDFESYTSKEKIVLAQLQYKLNVSSGISNGDTVKLSVEVNDELKQELNNMYFIIDSTTLEIKVDHLKVAPDSLAAIPSNEILKEEALAKATLDYGKQSQTYTNFKVVSTCFSNNPTNTKNFTDYSSSQPYTGTSVMYIISIENKSEDAEPKVFADNYGFTNILISGDKLDRSELKSMSPYQSFANESSIESQLRSNGFTCN